MIVLHPEGDSVHPLIQAAVIIFVLIILATISNLGPRSGGGFTVKQRPKSNPPSGKPRPQNK